MWRSTGRLDDMVSATKDIQHAVEHPVAVVDLDPESDPPKVFTVGADRAGNMLEVIVLLLAEDQRLVIQPCLFARNTTGCSKGPVMTEGKTYTTRTGKLLTDADIEAMADEAERGCDVEQLLERRRGRGRPMIGDAPSEVVAVRLDPALRQAVEARAEADHTTASDIVRQALKRFLDVA